jgi:hypothetical protein
MRLARERYKPFYQLISQKHDSASGNKKKIDLEKNTDFLSYRDVLYKNSGNKTRGNVGIEFNTDFMTVSLISTFLWIREDKKNGTLKNGKIALLFIAIIGTICLTVISYLIFTHENGL